jgi:endonuclease/exonuclease/phosphatase family metal-dependent hydrolase
MESPSELTIVSWNMWCFNRHLDDAFSFIQTQDFDVMCLQEVPEAFLERLRTLPFYVVESFDSVWDADIWGKHQGSGRYYLVILTKHQIQDHQSYPVVDDFPFTLRTRLFRLMMRYLADWSGGTSHDRTILSADIKIGLQTVRVFSVHLALMTPVTREKEFAYVREHLHPEHQNIVCGDFNILDFWLMKPLNWLLGGRLSEMLPWYNERAHMEKLFQGETLNDLRLENIFRGLVTHRFSHSQLDHILVPTGTEVISREVLSNAYGSDHSPIVATIKLAAEK